MKKLVILAMARSKKDAKEKIEDLSLTFAEHLSNLIFFDSKENAKHWRNELSAILYRVWVFSKVRGAKGVTKLSQAEAMDYLYETIWLGNLNDKKETLQGMYRFSCEHNRKLKPTLDLKKLSDNDVHMLLKGIETLYQSLVSQVLGKEFSRLVAEDEVKKFVKHMPF